MTIKPNTQVVMDKITILPTHSAILTTWSYSGISKSSGMTTNQNTQIVRQSMGMRVVGWGRRGMSNEQHKVKENVCRKSTRPHIPSLQITLLVVSFQLLAAHAHAEAQL